MASSKQHLATLPRQSPRYNAGWLLVLLTFHASLEVRGERNGSRDADGCRVPQAVALQTDEDTNAVGEAFAAVASDDSTSSLHRVILRKYAILGNTATHSEIWICPGTSPADLECFTTGFSMEGSRMAMARESQGTPKHITSNANPYEKIEVGTKSVSRADMLIFVQQMRICGNWGLEYHVLSHNCNSYSRAVLEALGFEEFVSELDRVPETRFLFSNKFLGHWFIDDRQCYGRKCLEPLGSSESCSNECSWYANNECKEIYDAQLSLSRFSSPKPTLVTRVHSSSFMAKACQWSIEQSEMMAWLQWAASFGSTVFNENDFKSAKKCMELNGQERNQCCGTWNNILNACAKFNCALEEAHLQELQSCCEEAGGLSQCLWSKKLSSGCTDTYRLMASSAGVAVYQDVFDLASTRWKERSDDLSVDS